VQTADSAGVAFKLADASNFYAFTMDARAGVHTLYIVQGGVWTALSSGAYAIADASASYELTVDYSARSANLSLTIAPTSAPDGNDGASGEGDDLTSTIENLCGSNRASACFLTRLLDYNGDGRTDFLSNYTCGYCSSIHYVGIGTP
jgi:hypothetical protein